MTMNMKTLVLALFGCLIAASAQAQSTSVAKEALGYHNMVVKLGDSVADCNLTDTNPLQARLADKLAAIGITKGDDFYSTAELRVNAEKFGGHCSTLVELVFVFPLGKDNFVTGDERLKKIIDRLNVIPVIVYKSARFGVQPQAQPSSGGKSTATEEAVLAAIDALVDTLEAKRQ